MATLTKKDLLEAIEDMPMDAEKGIWVTERGIRHVRQVSHWAYITPPR